MTIFSIDSRRERMLFFGKCDLIAIICKPRDTPHAKRLAHTHTGNYKSINELEKFMETVSIPLGKTFSKKMPIGYEFEFGFANRLIRNGIWNGFERAFDRMVLH